jgi:hypothetical protein
MRSGAEDDLASGRDMHAYAPPLHGIERRGHGSMVSPAWPRTQANAMDAHISLKLKKSRCASSRNRTKRGCPPRHAIAGTHKWRRHASTGEPRGLDMAAQITEGWATIYESDQSTRPASPATSRLAESLCSASMRRSSGRTGLEGVAPGTANLAMASGQGLPWTHGVS